MTLGPDQRFDEARANAKLDRAGLAGLQAARLRRLLWRCFLDVPAYRDRWQGKLVPSLIDDATDLSVLRGVPMPPVGERERAPQSFVAVGAVTIEVARWTPGPPVFADVESVAQRDAVRRRAEAGRPVVTVWGAEAAVAPRAFTDDECASLWRRGGILSLPESSAQQLSGRSQMIVRTATSERVAHQRQFVTAPEVGLVAATCDAGRLHIPADHLIVEILDDDVLVTDLGNHAAPYLRHRLPLRGQLGRCSCGLAFPTLEPV